jgi:D-alanyl-D-alanine carboxypeptidase-like protein
MADASTRGWGKGWPTDRRRDMAKVEAGGISVLVHREIAPIVAALMAETIAGGYRLNPGECWGYANRAIAGTSTPSNHSWGLAVDLNAPSNPMADRLITDMPVWMVELWRRRGFRWGGDYTGRKDPMHFEYLGTLADAHQIVAALKAPAIPAPPPTPRFVDYPEEPSMRRYDIAIALDSQGNGYTEPSLDVPYDRVVSLLAHGPYPKVDGYWNLPVLGRQDRDGKTVVTATEGPPNTTVSVTLWALD